jgi:hypothetical protein
MTEQFTPWNPERKITADTISVDVMRQSICGDTVSVKSWKEQKAERDAEANRKSRRVFVPKPEFTVPGASFTDGYGVQYYIAKDGSRRRVR